MRSMAIAAATFVLAGNAFAQNGDGSTVSYQGSFQIYAVTPGTNGAASPCDTHGLSAGFSGRIVYRYKNVSSDPNDAMALFFDESVYRIYSTDSSGSLNGAVQTTADHINPYANFYSTSSTTSNLAFASFSTSPIPSAGNIRVQGTLDNAFFVTGCTITIHAVLTKQYTQ